jgi:hypothetical protein
VGSLWYKNVHELIQQTHSTLLITDMHLKVGIKRNIFGFGNFFLNVYKSLKYDYNWYLAVEVGLLVDSTMGNNTRPKRDLYNTWHPAKVHTIKS